MHTTLRTLTRAGALATVWGLMTLGSPAQAGLLGGGSIGAGGGGAGGSLGVGVTRDGALPRPDRDAADAARHGAARADALADRSRERTRDTVAGARDRGDRAIERGRSQLPDSAGAGAGADASGRGELHRGDDGARVDGSADAAVRR